MLINGAPGGVGTYAVQIARALGGVVTAVCSTGKAETGRSLGADRVIDYAREDFTRGNERFDLMVDIAGTRSWRDCRRVLAPDATVVVVGGSRSNGLLGPLGHVAGMRLGALRGSRKVVFYVATFTKADMQTLRELLESGSVRSVIDRRYRLDEIADALTHQGEGHPDGKIVVDVSSGWIRRASASRRRSSSSRVRKEKRIPSGKTRTTRPSRMSASPSASGSSTGTKRKFAREGSGARPSSTSTAAHRSRSATWRPTSTGSPSAASASAAEMPEIGIGACRRFSSKASSGGANA